MHGSVLLFLSNLFSSDMIIIMFVALLLFGGEKLPDIARGLGKGIRDFKDASEGVKREINNQINSFEEKREEKRLDEAAVAAQQPAAEQPAAITEFTQGTIRPAENTMPFNDSHFVEDTGYETVNNEPVHAEHVAESHIAASYADNGTSNNEPAHVEVTESSTTVSHTDSGTTNNEPIRNSNNIVV